MIKTAWALCLLFGGMITIAVGASHLTREGADHRFDTQPYATDYRLYQPTPKAVHSGFLDEWENSPYALMGGVALILLMAVGFCKHHDVLMEQAAEDKTSRKRVHP